MKTREIITALREHLIANTSLEQVFSPELPLKGDNVACITALGGTTTNNLCNGVEYTDLTSRVLIRGNENDNTTRQLADEVFSNLHLTKDLLFNDGVIINIFANAPNYVGKDENNRILYNITFDAKVK